MIYIKRICNNYTELIQFLADCGFTTEVNGNYYYTPMYNDRGTANVTKMPYYDINTSGEGVLMLRGDEVFEGFNTSDGPVGCIAAKLIRTGIAICISQWVWSQMRRSLLRRARKWVWTILSSPSTSAGSETAARAILVPPSHGISLLFRSWQHESGRL